jgi:hypothetical protein
MIVQLVSIVPTGTYRYGTFDRNRITIDVVLIGIRATIVQGHPYLGTGGDVVRCDAGITSDQIL